jgi:signal transduction histidine kinase
MQDYRKRFNLKVAFTCTGERRRLPGEIELAVFRIAQESLTNVVRHSNEHQAKVELTFEPQSVKICIMDEGVGFAPDETQQSERQHWGILGMSERATQLNGTLEIESTPGAGTQVLAQLPLNMQSKRTENGRNN